MRKERMAGNTAVLGQNRAVEGKGLWIMAMQAISMGKHHPG